MADGLAIRGFEDPSLDGPVSISVGENELVVLTGPPGRWMSKLASRLAGLMPSRSAGAQPRPLVLLNPPFFDPSREVIHQMRNRLGAFGMNRQESSVAAVRWCEAEGLLDAARKTAGSHTEGLLSFFSLGIAAIVRPPSLVVEDPLPGLSAELADRSVGILEAISAGSRVLVLASDPLRFAGRSRIEAVRGSGGRR